MINREIEPQFPEACGMEEHFGLCKITEGDMAGPLPALVPDSCMPGRNAASLGCGVRWVEW